MYYFVRHALFSFSPERSHQVAMALLRMTPGALIRAPKGQPVQALGFEFPHRIGLAAGFDKNGEFIDQLAKLGFSFIEVGTVTPKPQLGNPKPRLFRLPKAHALINRMGFNNHGVDALVSRLQVSAYRGILGVNIGKNKDTPLAQAAEDYLTCLRKVYPYVSYITVNISSPNTPDLRKLQEGEYFQALVSTLREEQLLLADEHQRYVPLVIKLSPDEADDELKRMAAVIVANGIDGIIATNTTSNHARVVHLPHGQEVGGLSGRPLAERATECLAVLKREVGNEVTLIASGGVDSQTVAAEKINAGASLIQVYTGLIYQGPGLVADLAAV